MSEISLTVSADAGTGMRLDRYCATKTGTVSRSRLKSGMIAVTVNGVPAKMSRIVRENDTIIILWEDPPAELPVAENIPLDIIFENEDVTVVNKKQGMVTHPAAGNWSGTLVHALLWHWKKTASEGNLRPGIVHRLDKDTSGIIITARNPETETWLQEQFHSRNVCKVYAAILKGIPKKKQDDIKTQIARDSKDRKRFTWSDDTSKGRFAHTSYCVIKVYGSYSLVLFKLHTGRTHQIRVHSKYLGCPILGDPIYGKKDSLFIDATLMLHARTLKIKLPGSPKYSRFDAPIPIRFKKVIKILKEKFPE